ncbi:hypothetical protein EYF80_030798 [Liparis tanakae]|uniref:Uncharacterized protein n=1 Tax=Liparis tanakae TaxID=230148 RepID=A0A4Z2H2D2_9TELE|nr:hypothetical protein EYF80_030798 [Liparis tanakae]
MTSLTEAATETRIVEGHRHFLLLQVISMHSSPLHHQADHPALNHPHVGIRSNLREEEQDSHLTQRLTVVENTFFQQHLPHAHRLNTRVDACALLYLPVNQLRPHATLPIEQTEQVFKWYFLSLIMCGALERMALRRIFPARIQLCGRVVTELYGGLKQRASYICCSATLSMQEMTTGERSVRCYHLEILLLLLLLRWRGLDHNTSSAFTLPVGGSLMLMMMLLRIDAYLTTTNRKCNGVALTMVTNCQITTLSVAAMPSVLTYDV